MIDGQLTSTYRRHQEPSQPTKNSDMKALKYSTPILGLLLASGINASAVTLDLTAGGSGTINGALFVTTDQQPTGSGVIDPFVRLSQTANNTTAEGYNADARPVMPDVNTSATFTHDILLSSIGTTTIGNTSYYQFLLDINQTSNNPLLSLDELQIYTRTTALTSASTLTDLQTGSTLRYDLDGAGDSEILLDYSLNSGSGSGDLFAFIPQSAFGNAAPGDFVYLYSMFGAKGGDYAENDGFEEWATVSGDGRVPDGGGTLVLLGSALTCVGAFRRLTTKR
jgi:hypothetical protein